MEAKSNSRSRVIFRVILLLSLSLNVLFIWNDHYDVPDFNFYSHGLRDAYFIKSHAGGRRFVIEHSGHHYTVECQNTLTWLNGIYATGEPMSDGCTYIPSMVGKSIADGLMRKEGGALVFQAWENADTVQTADILTIVDGQKN